jgi:hypothetical protein
VEAVFGRTASYEARITVRPEDQDQQPSDPTVAIEDLDVRCGVGARLTPVGKGVTVDNTEIIDQDFDERGVLEWSWELTPETPEDAQVRLELRPAVATTDGRFIVPASDSDAPSARFTTDIAVDAEFVDAADYWMDENWGKVTTVVTLVAAAVAASLAWIRHQRKLLREENAGVAVPARGPAGPASPPASEGSPGASSSTRKKRPGAGPAPPDAPAE